MTSVDRTGSDAHVCAYNLFRNKELPDIVCAVPEICPVPEFISSDQWTFDHHLGPGDTCPSGFHEKAAKVATRFNGFYLFYAIASAPAMQTVFDIMGGL